MLDTTIYTLFFLFSSYDYICEKNKRPGTALKIESDSGSEGEGKKEKKKNSGSESEGKKEKNKKAPPPQSDAESSSPIREEVYKL